jgi:Transposase DDE domain
MHQTKKGNQRYFRMKGHFGVESRSKLIHAVAATPANAADSTVLPRAVARARDPDVEFTRPILPAQSGDPRACVPKPGISSIVATTPSVWPITSSRRKPQRGSLPMSRSGDRSADGHKPHFSKPNEH